MRMLSYSTRILSIRSQLPITRGVKHEHASDRPESSATAQDVLCDDTFFRKTNQRVVSPTYQCVHSHLTDILPLRYVRPLKSTALSDLGFHREAMISNETAG